MTAWLILTIFVIWMFFSAVIVVSVSMASARYDDQLEGWNEARMEEAYAEESAAPLLIQV